MAVATRPTTRSGRGYPDLREHLEALDRAGLLVRVRRPMLAETEIHPLVRWQYRGGLPEEDWRAFLFEDVRTVKGGASPFRVGVGVLAASKYVYATGLGCKPEEIAPRWESALANRIAPTIVEDGPVHEEVHVGDALLAKGGTAEFPIPISTPGFDNGPYTTCTHWFTKDPETGVRNQGNYRGQIKSPTRIGIFPSGLGQDVYIHWQKARKKGQHLPAALVIGGPPVVSYAAVQKVPYGIDELSIAGGLAGAPIRLVRCKTVPLEVPADAEIVFEGYINTQELEEEGPFGESHGYMHPRQLNPFFEITAITHRKDAIWVSFISQVTPSESSVIKKVAYEPIFTQHLRQTCNIRSVKRVVMHEPLTNLRKLIVIQMANGAREAEIWRALRAASSFNQGVGKVCVAVDEDIDPEDATALWWAVCYRSRPAQDVEITGHLEKGHAPPFRGTGIEQAAEGRDVVGHGDPADDSGMLINACLKEPWPPISLPTKEHMENALRIWNELGLPKV
ncbi:MAG TPA: UbiD family decarboxylase, partial [Candidatus Limnocylindria bacterium]|nr:UbiD family decarboxylase [Candidatus Limnocylindria bacterium]